MCVSNMKLYLFTEIEAKEACDWLKAAGFPQYAQLYEGNTLFLNWTCFLVFIIYFSHPLSLHPPIPYCVACCSLFSGFSSCAERWVMGKAYLSLLGLVLLFSIIFHLSPSTLSRVSPTAFPTFASSFPSLIWVFVHIQGFQLPRRRWRTPLFLSFFCSYWSVMHLKICKDSVCFTILFFCLTLWDAFFFSFKFCFYSKNI